MLIGSYTGVDLDYEHPQTWGPEFVNMNASFAAELRSKYSDFLRAMSSALHAKGFKMSECVGTYPTRSNGSTARFFNRPCTCLALWKGRF